MICKYQQYQQIVNSTWVIRSNDIDHQTSMSIELSYKSKVTSACSDWGLSLGDGKVHLESVRVDLGGQAAAGTQVHISLRADVIAGHIFVHDLHQESGVVGAHWDFQHVIEGNSVFLLLCFGSSLNDFRSDFTSFVFRVVEHGDGNIVLHFASEVVTLGQGTVQNLQSECHQIIIEQSQQNIVNKYIFRLTDKPVCLKNFDFPKHAPSPKIINLLNIFLIKVQKIVVDLQGFGIRQIKVYNRLNLNEQSYKYKVRYSGSLPPGVDSIDEDVIFGSMWIKMGTIKLIRTTNNPSYNVLCQFWGETTPTVLSTRFDTPHNEQQRTQKYNIKCPITFFVEYLHEMKNNLRLDVEGVGKISLDITKFIKKNVNIDSRVAFEHFKGFFEIIGKGNRKAGSLEIEMGCQFDPDIAIRQLGESGVQQIRKEQIANCPAQKLEVKSCCGHCVCVCPKRPKIIETKKQIPEDDPRIANSLNTKPPPESQFNARKYETNQDDQPKLNIKKTSEEVQKEKQGKKNQQFPEVPKILTYSNLRLNYDDPELAEQMEKIEDEIQKEEIKPISRRQVEEPPKIIEKKKDLIMIGESVEDSHYEIKAKPQISKEELMKQFYGAENSPFKSNFGPHQNSEEKFYKIDKSEQAKLSRVINLNEEMNSFKRIGAPPLLPAQILEHSIDINENRRFQTGRKGGAKSSLVLNLFIELTTQSVTLPTKERFTITYRPYGQKQRLTLGPNFSNKIELLNNVGENQIRKMGKTPFIIEFWSATQAKFIGLIKIDLSKIKQGFLMQDRLNQMAIKTNILPTTIQRGETKIIDLFDKQVGECSLYAGIGTPNQLNAYLNQKQNIQIKTNPKPVEKPQKWEKIEDPQKQEKKEAQQKNRVGQDHILDDKSMMGIFDSFLEGLYKNNNRLIDTLNKMMNKQYINSHELKELSKFISLGSGLDIFDMHRKITSHKEDIDFHQIANSFDDYIQVVEQVKEQLAIGAKTVRNLFSDPHAVVAQLKEKTPMKVISKKKAQEIMQKYARYHEPIQAYLSKFSQYINVDNISEALQNRSDTVPELAQISKDYINQIIIQRVESKLRTEKITFDKLKDAFAESSISLYELFKFFDGKISLWALLHWIEGMNKKNNEQSQHTISMAVLKKQWNYRIEDSVLDNRKQENTKRQRQPNIMPEILIPQSSNITNPLPEESNSHILESSKKQQIKPEIEPKKPEMKELEKKEVEKEIKGQEKKQEKKQDFYKHLFSIEPKELSLDHPIRGNCVVVYQFPFEDEQVKSKSFMTSVDKHKYSLQMYGTHGFTLQQPVDTYLGDNSIKFFVKVDKKIEYEGALPSDELLIQPNSEEVKIIPLFSERSEGIAGKIKLSISYERALAAQNNLGKQTTYQLFLPKSGYLNYALSSQLQPSKIRSQLNLKQEFYVALVLDVFYHHPTLRTQFPPFSSRLYADNSESMELAGALKLSLTPVVLQYLKTKSARLSLNIIYYSKQSGNFERKQVPFAVIQLPLINVIKAEGIKGDYAFKNKLGMFVTLANCALKYEKEPITKISSKQQVEKHLLSYWLILNFVEFLNFEMSKLSWIRMEFVVKGRKYATDKIQLEPYSVNFLNNASLLLKFTEQQFMDTKVIPVTIVTNTSEKLAIDINLKAIGRDLAQKKYSINNQYYVVVNYSSRATKMRLAAKTYCFRGGPLLSNFVNSLHQHLDTEVFDELDEPEQPENYDEILNIFKNKLKLTQKGLNQALSELDIGRNKSKLNFEFFTNRTYYKLDFTPILADSQADIDFLCEQLPTEATKQEILDYFQNNKIKLHNFRKEFLDRFCFKELNKIKADKNIEFLGIDNQIDLISFVRKIRIMDQSSLQNQNQTSNLEEKVVELVVLEGSNFQQLYNGIKPNSTVRIPDVGLQTQISHRNSSPYFNENVFVELDKDYLTLLRNLKVEVYHCTTDDDDAENILIGQGYLNINVAELRHSPRIMKVVLNSQMSRNMKATLNIKVGLADEKKHRMKQESSLNAEESADASRMGEILQDIRQEMATKHRLFQSSDQDD